MGEKKEKKKWEGKTGDTRSESTCREDHQVCLSAIRLDGTLLSGTCAESKFPSRLQVRIFSILPAHVQGTELSS